MNMNQSIKNSIDALREKYKIKKGDRVKCYVTINDKQGNEYSFWAVGECYYIGEKNLAFEGDDKHIYSVPKDKVELA